MLDNRSDLFALGTMLYLFFTGRRPFEAPTDLESIMRVRECRFSSPEEVKPDLHPDMVAIIKRAMQAKPADRFQSADEMMLAIENVQRTAYKPAGQTELKRWLAELQERDGIKTFARTAPPRTRPSLDEELDVGEGADVVFDQSDLMEVSEIMRGMQPTIAAVPPPLPKAAEPVGTAKTKVATSSIVTEAPPSSARRLMLAMIALGGLAIGGWWLFGAGGPPSNPGSPPRLPPPRPKRPAAGPPPEAKQPAVAMPKPPSPSAPDRREAPRVRMQRPVPHRRPRRRLPPLLPRRKRISSRMPNPSQRTASSARRTRSRNPKPPKPRPAWPSEQPPPQAVSVRIVSSPEGAVVSLGKRVFGRAPLNLRFRPGITYELDLRQEGLPEHEQALRRAQPAEPDRQGLPRRRKPPPESPSSAASSVGRRAPKVSPKLGWLVAAGIVDAGEAGAARALVAFTMVPAATVTAAALAVGLAAALSPVPGPAGGVWLCCGRCGWLPPLPPLRPEPTTGSETGGGAIHSTKGRMFASRTAAQPAAKVSSAVGSTAAATAASPAQALGFAGLAVPLRPRPERRRKAPRPTRTGPGWLRSRVAVPKAAAPSPA